MLDSDFTRIYHVDLHGNVRRNPKLSGTTHNVFGIQVGVGITVAVRKAAQKRRQIAYHRVPEEWRKEAKLAWLATVKTVSQGQVGTPVSRIAQHNWIVAGACRRICRICRASATSDDNTCFPPVFHGREDAIATRSFTISTQWPCVPACEAFAEHYNREVDRYLRRHGEVKTSTISSSTRICQVEQYAQVPPATRASMLSSGRPQVETCLYRPFAKQYLYYDRYFQ